MDALRCPPGGHAGEDLVRRRAAPRRACAGCCLQKPDILLLDEPTNHLDAESVAWLEQHLQSYAGHGHRRDSRPLFSRQRRRLDSGTRSRPGHSVERQLHVVAGTETGAAAARGKIRERTAEDAAARARMDSHVAQSAPRQRQGAHQRLRSAARPGERRNAARIWRFTIPPGPRLGNVVIEAEGVSKAYGDNLLVEDMTFKLPPGGIVGVIGPNGAGKTTLFRMITGQEKPDSGTIRSRRDG